MGSSSISCGVACPECKQVLEFELTGDAELAKGPETLTIRYLPIVIAHTCKINDVE